jgi:transposase IS66 family protein
MVSVAGSTNASLVRARRGALDGVEVASRAWDDCSAGVPCSGLLRSWTRVGSLRFPGDPFHAFALLQDPGRADRTSPLAVLSMLPPVPTNRRPQRAHDLEAATGLQHPPPTLHEQRCRHPCKADFRPTGCAFAGRELNPLDRFERFQVLSFLLSRTSPDASWIHAERLVHKLETFTDQQRVSQQHVRGLMWWFYADLKAYRLAPTRRRRSEMRARFDRIFQRRTGFVTLDRLLQRLHANKGELLMVLDHPEIPLHTNDSENDIRCQVTKRHVSGGTHSDIGRDCRDAFLGLAKTCRKLGVAFWDYLGARLGVCGGPPVPQLPDLIRCRRQPA